MRQFKFPISFHPEIHFTYLMFTEVERNNLNLEELYKHCEELRIAAKTTTYTWDNSHFFIDDICGRPTLKFAIYKAFEEWSISFYNARTNHSLESFDRIPTQKEIKEMLDNIWDDLELCDECGLWSNNRYGHIYSFAGWVCNHCYDKTKHLPPDTRGD